MKEAHSLIGHEAVWKQNYSPSQSEAGSTGRLTAAAGNR